MAYALIRRQLRQKINKHIRLVLFGQGNIVLNLDPVSYTHLDVYKRQVINCAACNNKRANILTKAEYPSYPKVFIKNALTTKSMRQLTAKI